MTQSIVRSFVLGCVFCLLSGLELFAADIVARLWANSFRGDSAEYDFVAGVRSSIGDTVYLVVQARPRGQLSGQHSLELWAIDSTGKRLYATPIFSKNDQPGSAQSRLVGMAIDKSGRLIVNLEKLNLEKTVSETLVQVIDANSGKQLLSKALVGVMERASGALFDGGNAIVFGSSGGKVVIAHLGRNLDVTKTTHISDGNVSIVTSITSVLNGYVALGTGFNDKGEPHIWLGKLNRNWEVQATAIFPGREARLMSSDDTGHCCLLVTQQAAEKRWDIWLRALDDQLRETSIAKAAELTGFPGFDATYLGQGEFLVTGLNKSNVWIGTFNSVGPPDWHEEYVEPESQWQQPWRVAAFGGKTDTDVVLTNVAAKGTPLRQQQFVTVIRYIRDTKAK